ncbi:MAG: hypothetical protein KAX40_08385 [Herpetosiphon sp.]|nr:hypothetical protein [Herpetosiphon sp.]
MAITSRDLRTTEAARRTRPTTVITLPHHVRQTRGISMSRSNTFIYLVTLVLALFVANALFSPIFNWAKIKMDDMRYGRPRTVQTSAFVGHDEANGLPSHFVAMNLERRVVIMEMPGGDAAKARTIVGPYLFGAGEDLTPVQLRFEDVNADQRPDMLVSVKQEEMVYINDAASNQFRMITAEELALLQQK